MRIINLNDIEEQDKKKFLLLVVLCGIVTLTVFLTIFVNIWAKPIAKNSDEKSTEEKKVGTYSNITFTFEEQIKLYFTNINTLLSSNNYDELYKLLDDDFLKFSSLNQDNFKEYLNKKNIMGRAYKLVEYKNIRCDEYNVIKLSMQSVDNSQVLLNLIVKERSPNDYTILFDNLIKYNFENKEYENNGLKVVLSNQAVFSNEYHANINIMNASGTNITLNKNEATEILYLNQGKDNNTIVSSSIFMGEKLTLKPNASINYNIRFLISDFTFNLIQKLIIKDVTYDNINNTQDIEININ